MQELVSPTDSLEQVTGARIVEKGNQVERKPALSPEPETEGQMLEKRPQPADRLVNRPPPPRRGARMDRSATPWRVLDDSVASTPDAGAIFSFALPTDGPAEALER